MPVDPNEPTYCLCQQVSKSWRTQVTHKFPTQKFTLPIMPKIFFSAQVSYGEMIGCDNADCPIEWFHFGCMNLTTKPKGKWYCPKCITQFKKKK